MVELPIHYPKMKIRPLPSSTPITLGHHILVRPQRCNCLDPVPHSPEGRVSWMLTQCNNPTVLPCRMNSTFDVSTDFRGWCRVMRQWEQLVPVFVCLGTRSSIIAHPSMVDWGVLSSDKLFIKLLRFPTQVVLCCRLCQLCRVVKTRWLTCVKHRRRGAALKEVLPFEVHTEWYWVVVAVWGTLEHKEWKSRHTQVCENEAKFKLRLAQKIGPLGKTRQWGVLSKVCVGRYG